MRPATARPPIGSPPRRGERAAALAALADGKDLFAGDETRFFAAPASLDSLAALYARYPDATLVAGATDVGLWITKQLRELGQVIWLGRVSGLDTVGEAADGALSLGAGVTLSDAAPLLQRIHPDLGDLMRRFGSVQVRASGTVGGNIANGSPIGDLAPALIALGGRVVLRKGQATRSLPLEDFFIGYGKQDRAPGEFVLAIESPALADCQHYRAFKISKRFDEDISAVMLAARIDLEGRRIAGARIAYGGMAATPKRATNAERALIGADLDAPESWRAALDALASDFAPLTDQRATAAYRMTAAIAVLAEDPDRDRRRRRADPHWSASCRRMTFWKPSRPRSSTSRCRTIPPGCTCRARRPISTTSASRTARCMSPSACRRPPRAN